jgi:hypothetical protein
MELRSRINRILPTSEIIKHSSCVSLDDFFEDLIDSLYRGHVEFIDEINVDKDFIKEIYETRSISFAIDMLSDFFPQDGYIIHIEIPIPMKVEYNKEIDDYDWDETFCHHSITFVYVKSLEDLENKLNVVESKIINFYVELEIERLKKEKE